MKKNVKSSPEVFSLFALALIAIFFSLQDVASPLSENINYKHSLEEIFKSMNVKPGREEFWNKRLSVQAKAFLLCAAIASVIIVPIMIASHGYFALSNDFTAEEIPFGMLMNQSIKSGEIWNQSIDLGGNLLESFAFYNIGSIFFWISMLFPATWYPRIIGLIFILKFAVAGYASATWMRRYLCRSNTILIGAVLYAFSGAQCINTVFYHFQDVVALFPFMLAAVDELIEDHKFGRLALACALNMLCNPIFFFGSVCFTILYYIFRYLYKNVKEKGQIKWIALCFWEGALGCLMASVVAVPAILSMLNSERAASTLAPESWLSMTTEDWLIRIQAFFLPAESMDSYSAISWCNWGSWNVYLPLFGMVFVIAYCIEEKTWLSSIVKTGLLISAVPILNSVFIAFSPDKYARWLFMLSLVMALATAKVVEDAGRYKTAVYKSGCLSLAVLLFYVYIVAFAKWDGENTLPVWRERKYGLIVCIAILSVLVCVAAEKFKTGKYDRTFLRLTSIVGCGLFAITIVDYQSGAPDNTNIDFHQFSTEYSESAVTYLTDVPLRLEKNVLPYRYYFDEGIGYSYYNFGMVNSLPSINSFISTCHPGVVEFYHALGINRPNMTYVGPVGTGELLGAKHIVTQSYIEAMTPVDSLENGNGQIFYIYENDLAIPLGTTYDSYITKSEFDTVEDTAKAVLMLHTLVVEDEDEERVKGILRHSEDYRTITPDSIDEVLLERNRNAQTNFQTQKNGFVSLINAETKQFAFYSVPYDQYWTATVNGKKTDILKINGLMAIEVDKGTNEIEFRYHYWPLRLAAIASLAGMLLCLLYIRRFPKNKGELS